MLQLRSILLLRKAKTALLLYTAPQTANNEDRAEEWDLEVPAVSKAAEGEGTFKSGGRREAPILKRNFLKFPNALRDAIGEFKPRSLLAFPLNHWKLLSFFLSLGYVRRAHKNRSQKNGRCPSFFLF